MRVKNAENTAKEKCCCLDNEWKEHWKLYSGKLFPKYCSVNACRREAEVGAHVEMWEQGQFSKDLWIIPMCRHHNGEHEAELTVKDGTVAVTSQNVCCNKVSYVDVIKNLINIIHRLETEGQSPNEVQ